MNQFIRNLTISFKVSITENLCASYTSKEKYSDVPVNLPIFFYVDYISEYSFRFTSLLQRTSNHTHCFNPRDFFSGVKWDQEIKEYSLEKQHTPA